MRYFVLKSIRGGYLSQNFKYLAQPYVAQLNPDFKPVLKYQVVNMYDDTIAACNLTETEVLEWLEEVME